MLLFSQLLMLTSLLMFSKSQHFENFEEYFQYINTSIIASEAYIKPKNNEQLFATNSSEQKLYGNYDFIIVGAGSAGALLASRLSEITNWKILLLEAGGNQTKFSDIPGLSPFTEFSDLAWSYYTSSQTGTCLGNVDNKCLYPRGKALGGTATINHCIYTRGIPADYDSWEKLGNKGWSFKDVLPYFKRTEKVEFPNYDQGYHGTNGKIHVNYSAPESKLASTLFRASFEKGLKYIDYNGRGILGVTKVQLTIKGNRRDNSAYAYLDPTTSQRRNLNITTNAFVTKILVNQKSAYGVNFIKGGVKCTAYATKEVILSAGTINSPQLLLLSGIGPAEELRALDIEVNNNIPAVGKNMQDHPKFLSLYIRTNNSETLRSLYEDVQRYVAGLTPLTNEGPIEMMGFLNTRNNSEEYRDVQFYSMQSTLQGVNLSYNFRDDIGQSFSQYNIATDVHFPVLVLKPKSKGSVTLSSSSPNDFPIIDINFFSDSNNEDIETMYRGIKFILSLTETEAFKKVNGSHVGLQPNCEHLRNISDRQYWYCAIRFTTAPVYNAVGTTRMGRSIRDSVVDHKCRVHNMKGLRVVDAGVIPEIPSGNPNAPIYMIAEKIADVIKDSYNVGI